MARIKIPPGLRGTITQTGKTSYRVDLSLGRNAKGGYDRKRETIRGTAQDAIDLLIRWNVQYMDNTITVTNYETVQDAYDEWIKEIKMYRTINTYRFYKQRFEDDLLPELGHMKLKDVTINAMQTALASNPANDRHNKRAIRALMHWCADNNKIPHRLDFRKLKTKSQPKKKQETDVWSFEQVQLVYKKLTFDTLYDIFVVLGIECGLRPQEILALTWDKIKKDHLVIDTAVKHRTPGSYTLGPTKTEQDRLVATTPYLMDKLTTHRINQEIHISRTRRYNKDAGLVVADKMGNVANLNYIRKYMRQLAGKAGVQYIPPKNLRSTHISLLTALGVPLSVIQEQVGHEDGSSVTSEHYVRVFSASLKNAATLLHQRLHGDQFA